MEELKLSVDDSVVSISFYDKRMLLSDVLVLNKRFSDVFIITDSNVFKAQNDFFSSFKKGSVFVLPAGEEHKNLDTVSVLTKAMSDFGLDRKGVVVAVGGGVVTDISAFAANIYKRGVNLILVPTSLLAMVDASVGGKTGVDTAWGKNQIGTFYWPESVFVCLDFLSTLPEIEVRNGVAEMLKHGIIASKKHFNAVKNCVFEGCRLECLRSEVIDSIRIKIDIVERDLRETAGERIKLNLGHTFAHAIELDSDYKISHGHAVAIGLKLAAKFGLEKGVTDASVVDEIFFVVDKLFPDLNDYDVSKLWEYMALDKKRNGEKVNFVLPKKIGEVAVYPVDL